MSESDTTATEAPHCQRHDLPQTRNPHPQAGEPSLEFGYEYQCIPCLVMSRRGWRERCYEAEKRVEELKQASTPRAEPVAHVRLGLHGDAAIYTKGGSSGDWRLANFTSPAALELLPIGTALYTLPPSTAPEATPEKAPTPAAPSAK